MTSSPDYSSELRYKIDDIPPTGETITLGFQHYLTMFGSTVAAPLIMAGQIGHAAKSTELSCMIGTTFVGKLVGEAEVGAGGDDAVRGVVPAVTGRAWITQHCTVVLDPTDPFPVGYTVGDIW